MSDKNIEIVQADSTQPNPNLQAAYFALLDGTGKRLVNRETGPADQLVPAERAQPNGEAQGIGDNRTDNIADGGEPQTKTERLDNGNIKTTHSGDGSYLVKQPGEKGNVVETRDAHGEIFKYKHKDNGEIEIQVGDTDAGKVYPKAKINDEGTLTWSDGQHSYKRRLNGYRESRNLKDDSVEITWQDGSQSKERRDDKGVHTTKFTNGQKVSEETEFTKPTPLTIESVNGNQEFKNVSNMATYYDSKSGRPIAQSLKFAAPGLPRTVNVPGGKLVFNASALDIFKPEGGKPSEAIYYSDKAFILNKANGEESMVSADRLHETKNKNGIRVLALSSGEQGMIPLASIYDKPAQSEKKDSLAPAGQHEKISDEHKAQIKELILRLSSNKYSERDSAHRDFIKLGREAFPQLRKLANGKDADLSSWAKTIMAAQYRKPLPDQFIEEMQERNLSLFLAKATDGTNNLGQAARTNFEQLIAQADQPLIGGLDQQELEIRKETAVRSREMAGEMAQEAQKRYYEILGKMGKVTDEMLKKLRLDLGLDNEWPRLPVNNHEAAEIVVTNLQQQPASQLAIQEDLLAKAVDRSGNVRAAYALALSGTGNKSDREEAVKLLTEAVKRNPTIGPTVRDDGMRNVGVEGKPIDDFMKAVIQSKAYEDPKFVETFSRYTERPGVALQAIIDLAKSGIRF